MLRQQILQCEGELRTVTSPAYTARDRDRALAEQSVSLQSPVVLLRPFCPLSSAHRSHMFFSCFAFCNIFLFFLLFVYFCFPTDEFGLSRFQDELLMTLCHLQACRERIKGLQSKITAFSQRMNLINQRGTPDQEEMTREWEKLFVVVGIIFFSIENVRLGWGRRSWSFQSSLRFLITYLVITMHWHVNFYILFYPYIYRLFKINILFVLSIVHR